MIVRLNTAAQADLADIGDWIARESPRRAESYVAELLTACEGLAEHAERFARVFTAGADRLHRRVHGRHIIYYAIEEQAVTVVRIIDGSRDMRRMLDLS